jgi:hypothetical protein
LGFSVELGRARAGDFLPFSLISYLSLQRRRCGCSVMMVVMIEILFWVCFAGDGFVIGLVA